MSSPYPYSGLSVFSPKLLSYSLARKQVSQYGAATLGIRIIDLVGKPAVADTISMALYRDDDYTDIGNPTDEQPYGVVIRQFPLDEIATPEVGLYTVDIGPDLTATRGNLTALWTYTVDGTALTYTDYLQITEPMPYYDALRPEEKALVEQVSWMFADLFDSTNGGPNLTENFQTHFNFNRMAQLMRFAMVRINTYGVPLMNYGLGEGTTPLPEEFDQFLLMGTYLETMLHFVRTYLEQPDFRNMSVTYTDRRDYFNRWKSLYDDEKRNYDQQLKVAKRKLIGLSRGALLVSGGIYGGDRFFKSGTYSAQVRGYRFWPAAPVVFMTR